MRAYSNTIYENQLRDIKKERIYPGGYFLNYKIWKLIINKIIDLYP